MRAIILAAGMGTRLRPLTETTPKSLICVGKEPLIERQIRFLHDRDITDITIVTGYLHEQFDYLVDKYGVSLVYNEHYATYNNFYSMYLVRDLLADAYVIDADNYLVHNFLLEQPAQSMYFSAYKKDFTDEWLLLTNQSDTVTGIVVSSGEGYILSGVSYWSPQDGAFLATEIARKFTEGHFAEIYWDNMVMDNIERLNILRYDIPSDATYEIDSLSDLEALRAIVE